MIPLIMRGCASALGMMGEKRRRVRLGLCLNGRKAKVVIKKLNGRSHRPRILINRSGSEWFCQAAEVLMRLCQLGLVMVLVAIVYQSVRWHETESPKRWMAGIVRWFQRFQNNQTLNHCCRMQTIAPHPAEFSLYCMKLANGAGRPAEGRAMVNIRIVNSVGETSDLQADRRPMGPIGMGLVTVYGDCVLRGTGCEMRLL